MAIISKGILGGFSGTVGTVIGSTWKGIPNIRSRPGRQVSEPTVKQLVQRAKFALAANFLQPFNGLLAVTFQNCAPQMTEINSALSYVLLNAITGAYPSFSIDFANVLVSRGDLPNVLSPTVSVESGTDLKFDWISNAGKGRARADDKAILVVYCAARKSALYTTGSALRSAGTETFPAAVFSGQTVETYIGFISDNGRYVASSIYTGQVNLVP